MKKKVFVRHWKQSPGIESELLSKAGRRGGGCLWLLRSPKALFTRKRKKTEAAAVLGGGGESAALTQGS